MINDDTMATEPQTDAAPAEGETPAEGGETKTEEPAKE